MVSTVTELCRPAIGGQASHPLFMATIIQSPTAVGFWAAGFFLPGPWLEPGFREKLFFDLPTTTAMMKIIIDQFNAIAVEPRGRSRLQQRALH